MKKIFLLVLIIASGYLAHAQPFGNPNTDINVLGGLKVDSLMLPPLYSDTPTSVRVRVNGSIVRVAKSGDTSLYSFNGHSWDKIGSSANLQDVTENGDSTSIGLVSGDTTNQGGILSMFGDSFTLGGGATLVTTPYTALLSGYLHLTPKIHAHGGATAHHGTPHNSNGDLIDSLSAIEIKPTANSKLMFVYTFNDACAQVANSDYTATHAIADISTAIDTALRRGWSLSDIELCTLWCMDTTQIISVCGASMTMQRFRNFVDTVKYLGSQRGVRVTDLFTAFYNRYYKAMVGSDNYHPNDIGHREASADMLAMWGYKLVSNGGTRLAAPLYSANGIPEMTLDTNGNVRVENKMSINANPLANTYLYVPSTNKMVAASLGYVDVQAISLNNVFVGNNLYYLSGYKHRYAGYSSLLGFQSNSIVALIDNTSGSADGAMTVSCPLALIGSGAIGIGGILSRGSATDISGAAIKVWPNTYDVTIGTANNADSNYKLFVGGVSAFNSYIVYQNLSDYSSGGKKYYVINQTTKRGETISAIPSTDIAGLPIYGSSTQSGNGSTTVFNIAHGLGTTPSYWEVTAASSAAVGSFYVTADATNLIITYSVAPASGTNNLTFKYSAK